MLSNVDVYFLAPVILQNFFLHFLSVPTAEVKLIPSGNARWSEGQSEV